MSINSKHWVSHYEIRQEIKQELIISTYIPQSQPQHNHSYLPCPSIPHVIHQQTLQNMLLGISRLFPQWPQIDRSIQLPELSTVHNMTPGTQHNIHCSRIICHIWQCMKRSTTRVKTERALWLDTEHIIQTSITFQTFLTYLKPSVDSLMHSRWILANITMKNSSWTHTHRQTDRQTDVDISTHRHTVRDLDTHTDRHTDTQTCMQ